MTIARILPNSYNNLAIAQPTPKPSGRLLIRQHHRPHRKHLRRTPHCGSKKRMHTRPRRNHLGCRLADKSNCRQCLCHIRLHDKCGCVSNYCGGLHYYREGGLGWEWASVDEGKREMRERRMVGRCMVCALSLLCLGLIKSNCSLGDIRDL